MDKGKEGQRTKEKRDRVYESLAVRLNVNQAVAARDTIAEIKFYYSFIVPFFSHRSKLRQRRANDELCSGAARKLRAKGDKCVHFSAPMANIFLFSRHRRNILPCSLATDYSPSAGAFLKKTISSRKMAWRDETSHRDISLGENAFNYIII